MQEVFPLRRERVWRMYSSGWGKWRWWVGVSVGVLGRCVSHLPLMGDDLVPGSLFRVDWY